MPHDDSAVAWTFELNREKYLVLMFDGIAMICARSCFTL